MVGIEPTLVTDSEFLVLLKSFTSFFISSKQKKLIMKAKRISVLDCFSYLYIHFALQTFVFSVRHLVWSNSGVLNQSRAEGFLLLVNVARAKTPIVSKNRKYLIWGLSILKYK